MRADVERIFGSRWAPYIVLGLVFALALHEVKTLAGPDTIGTETAKVGEAAILTFGSYVALRLMLAAGLAATAPEWVPALAIAGALGVAASTGAWPYIVQGFKDVTGSLSDPCAGHGGVESTLTIPGTTTKCMQCRDGTFVGC